MIRFAFIVFLSLTAFAGMAQRSSNATEILENVREHYDKSKGFSADFVFTIDIPEQDNQVMKGKLFLKGDKYRLQMDDQEIISDDITLWQWMKSVNEVQVNYVEQDENMISPSRIFSLYLKGHKYQHLSSTKFEGRNIALIEIVPEDRSTEYFKIKATVNTDKDQLEEMQIFYKDGTVYTFRIRNEKTTSLLDNFFSFIHKEHPEVELIDLR